jgi:hypothetical protein
MFLLLFPERRPWRISCNRNQGGKAHSAPEAGLSHSTLKPSTPGTVDKQILR